MSESGRSGNVRVASLAESPVELGDRELRPTPPRAQRLRDLLREAPRTVWVITGLFACLLVAWSVLMPMLHATDEPNHVDRVLNYYEGHGWPAPGDARVSVQTLGLVDLAPFGAPKSPWTLAIRVFPASEATPRSDRPTLAQVQGPEHLQGQVLNQLTNHPPGYYMLLGGALRVVDAKDWRWDVLLATLRLTNALFMLPLPFLAWAAARRITADASLGLAAAVMPFGLPTLTHLGSAVNNDNLLILLASLLMLRLIFVMQGDLSRRTAIWVGLLLGLALFTKGLALPLVPCTLFAYLIGVRRAATATAPVPSEEAAPRTERSVRGRRSHRRRSSLRELRTSLVFVAVIAFALGGWWWGVNLLTYHTVQPGVPGYPLFLTLGPDIHFGKFVWYALGTVPARWWGVFGFQELQLSALAVQIAAALLIGLLSASFIAARRRRGATTDLVFLLSPTLLLLVFVIVPDTADYLSRAQVAGLHGRYLYGGLVPLFAAAVYGLRLLPMSLRRWMPLVFLALVTVMQFVAVRLVLKTYWIPWHGGTLRQGWKNLSAWSAWPPGVLQGLLVLGLVLFAVTVVALARSAVRSSETVCEVERLRVAPEELAS